MKQYCGLVGIKSGGPFTLPRTSQRLRRIWFVLIREIRGGFIGHELPGAVEPQPNQKADHVHVHVNDHVNVHAIRLSLSSTWPWSLTCTCAWTADGACTGPAPVVSVDGARKSLTPCRPSMARHCRGSCFTTETRRARRFHRGIRVLRASPCAPCLRGETGRLAAPGSLSEIAGHFD